MILGIETSCDETSVALVDDEGVVRSTLTASQIERHRPFGGVVPEIASREHLEFLFPLIRDVVGTTDHSAISAVAVTNGPGLIGALLVGVAGAQGLAWALGKPLLGVNHLEGHIFSPFLSKEGAAAAVPDHFCALVVSGGHSSFYDVRHKKPMMLNKTRDDAIGETFDKVAKALGLPYPGGPQIEKHARMGVADSRRFPFPSVHLKDGSLDFSYSGIKAAAIRMARAESVGSERDAELLAAFCATFQDALFEQLFDRLEALWSKYPSPPSELALSGGVAANGVLRERLVTWGEKRGVPVRLPEKRYCTDNAAMIAFAALHAGSEQDPRSVRAYSRAKPFAAGSV